MPTASEKPETWRQDEWGCYHRTCEGKKGRFIHAWISARPGYCDRGRFMANAQGNVGLDWQDGFPRYYMRLEIAMEEMELWMELRLSKH